MTYRLAVFLGAIILALSSGVANASTALLLGGRGKYSTLTEEQMSSAFGGYFATYDKRVNLPFPGNRDFYGSVAVGADNLYAAVYDPQYAGPKTIGGVSEGAPSVMEVLRRLQADAADETDGKEPPPPTELNVAIYAPPSKRFLGELADLPVPVTPYDILIVKAEYDGLADFPDNPFNVLAVWNAVLGGFQLHVKRSNFDIRNNPTEYTVETNSAGGTTTTILIPTEVLPVLRAMVVFHFNPKFVARMDDLLRPIIDRAYDRPEMQTGIPPTLTGPPGPSETTTVAEKSAAAPVSAMSAPAAVAQPTVTARARAASRAAQPAEQADETDADHQTSAPKSDAGDSGGILAKIDRKLELKKAAREADSTAAAPEKPRQRLAERVARAADRTPRHAKTAAGDDE